MPLAVNVSGEAKPLPHKSSSSSGRSYAQNVAICRMRETDEPSGQICTGLSNPRRIGPITSAPPSDLMSWVEMAAEWMAGMIRTFAGSLSRWKG